MSSDINTILAAYYRAIGYSVDEIHLALPGVDSKSSVNRYLAAARKEGYLKEIEYFKLSPNRYDEVSPYITDFRAANCLRTYFGAGRLQHVVIVPVPPTFEESNRDTRIRDLVGKAAAVHILNILINDTKRNLIIGVSFGRTMLAVCQALKDMAPLEPNPNLTFVPLIGGLSVLQMELDPLAFQCAASTLAAELSRIFRGGAIEGQLMLNTPAFIPTDYIKNGPKQDINVAKRFIAAIPEYNEIFGKDGLITKMDMMISSVGPRGAGWLEEGGPLMDTDERQQLLSEGVVGDICGRFILQDEVEPKTGKTKEVNDRVLGATPSHFSACALRAHKNKTPGVIMVANSPTKAEAVLTAVRSDCVSMLVIDSELAQKINELVPGLEMPFSTQPQFAPNP